jgi:hypothetical protein
MKIDPLANQRLSSPRRKERGEAARSGAFARELEGETPATASVGANANLGPVDALLALQEVPDSLAGSAGANRRGKELLDELEQLRLALLAGVLPRERLDRLARMLTERREQIEDPGLAAVIDEIELRAAVELAKLER